MLQKLGKRGPFGSKETFLLSKCVVYWTPCKSPPYVSLWSSIHEGFILLLQFRIIVMII